MTPQKIKEALHTYAAKHGHIFWKIKKEKAPNPFPIGRENLYRASQGKPIGDGLTYKLIKFFQKPENQVQNGTD